MTLTLGQLHYINICPVVFTSKFVMSNQQDQEDAVASVGQSINEALNLLIAKPVNTQDDLVTVDISAIQSITPALQNTANVVSKAKQIHQG